MYITLTYNQSFCDYMIQAGEEVHKYLPYGWHLVNVVYRPKGGL